MKSGSSSSSRARQRQRRKIAVSAAKTTVVRAAAAVANARKRWCLRTDKNGQYEGNASVFAMYRNGVGNHIENSIETVDRHNKGQLNQIHGKLAGNRSAYTPGMFFYPVPGTRIKSVFSWNGWGLTFFFLSTFLSFSKLFFSFILLSFPPLRRV